MDLCSTAATSINSYIKNLGAEFGTVQRPKTARNACKSKSIRVLHAATGTNLNLKSKIQSQQAIDRAFWPKKKSKTSLMVGADAAFKSFSSSSDSI